MTYTIRVIVEDESGAIVESEDLGSSDSRTRASHGIMEVAESVTTLFEDAGLDDLLSGIRGGMTAEEYIEFLNAE